MSAIAWVGLGRRGRRLIVWAAVRLGRGEALVPEALDYLDSAAAVVVGKAVAAGTSGVVGVEVVNRGRAHRKEVACCCRMCRNDRTDAVEEEVVGTEAVWVAAVVDRRVEGSCLATHGYLSCYSIPLRP